MEEYLAVCQKKDINIVDKYYQIEYDDLSIWIPIELADKSIVVALNPWPSDLPNRELVVLIDQKT